MSKFWRFALVLCEDCDPFDDVDVTGRDHNPDGVPYPTDNLGLTPRSGNTPGQHIPNFTYRGYVDSNREAGLQTISLADIRVYSTGADPTTRCGETSSST